MSRGVDCQCQAFQRAIEVLGRPWNALVLTALQDGPRRFSELAALPHGPADKILSARLKDLETRGLVLRHVEPGPPVRVTYELTAAGRAFGGVSVAIQRWGQDLADPARPRRRPVARRSPAPR